MSQELRVFSFETELGWIGVELGGEIIHRLKFGWTRREQAKDFFPGSTMLHKVSCDFESELRDRLTRYATGEKTSFDDFSVFVDSMSDFQKLVIGECRKIAYGQTLTYAQLASRAKAAGAARAVGNVMKTNPVPLIVPCHRVIGAQNQLGGFSAGQGRPTKHQLLGLEGALLF